MNREEWTMNNLEFLETSVWRVYFLNKYTSWKGREEIIEELKNFTLPYGMIDFLVWK